MLDLSRNLFTTFDPTTFTHSPLLNHLMLAIGKLNWLHPDTFAPLTSLNGLMVRENEIESLTALKFGSVESINMLDFSQNFINEIDPEILNYYPGNRTSFMFGLMENICVSGHFGIRKDLERKLWSCFMNWREKHSTTTTTTTKSPSGSNHANCRFYLDHVGIYSCVLQNVGLFLESIGGEHLTINGKTYGDDDVEAVYLTKSSLTKVPDLILSKFPNVSFVSIQSKKARSVSFLINN